MAYIIILGIALAFLLIALLKGSSPQIPYQTTSLETSHPLGQRPPGGKKPPAVLSDDWKRLQALTLPALEDFCRRLAESHGLAVRSVDSHSNREVHVLAFFDNPLLRGNLVICGYLADASGVVGSDTVISFSDMVKAERAMKGIFVTNGFFSEEVMKLNEGANIELIDVGQLLHWMTKVSPDLLPPVATPAS